MSKKQKTLLSFDENSDPPKFMLECFQSASLLHEVAVFKAISKKDKALLLSAAGILIGSIDSNALSLKDRLRCLPVNQAFRKVQKYV